MNILFVNPLNTDTIQWAYSKQQNCVDWTERLKKHLQVSRAHDGIRVRDLAAKTDFRSVNL